MGPVEARLVGRLWPRAALHDRAGAPAVSAQARLEPAGLRAAVVVGEGDQLGASRAPAGIARAGGTTACLVADHAQRRTGLLCRVFEHARGLGPGRVVDDDDLVPVVLQSLVAQ